MSGEELLVDAAGPVLTVTFNRPAQRNAMTWAMYQGLAEACARADRDERIRVLVLRGAGGKAFVAGTDIAQFAEFTDGADGVAYERRISEIVGGLAAVRVPTVAAIDGYCVGGGLAIAAACDLRLAGQDARFGVPIARTLGNCLSTDSLSLLVHRFGESRTTEMLLTARLLTAEEARSAGFVLTVTDELDSALAHTVERLLGHAPLSMWATKEGLRRLRDTERPGDEDIIAKVYGSADFHHAVEAFTRKEPPRWSGH
ncbi:enoyl-CoA hydratase/isomerase family protein [Amycolatopsis nigrescens]|uniref:enoyl-CoA hydratase/isomerase family protein n=1 Tax=Amycolatopsis nigrescens TaxID=381445 RepID=UPI00036E1476|nr:enoyl-CoA hydratase/isomerase family protein [Amycolatopsis nigrescens]